jgi:hypothetical protein
MRSISILLLLITTCLGASARQSKEYSGYVKYGGPSITGTLTVISTGFGKDRALCSADALIQAFRTLLFQGIPGSQYELPMVPPDKKEDVVISDLLDKEYRSFVIENNMEREEKKVRRTDGAKGKMTVHRITINCEALKRYLENKGLIRKFGL